VVLIGLAILTDVGVLRFLGVRRLIESRPSLLYYRGEFIDRTMRRERVLRSEVHAAMRRHGIGALSEVDAVVLESSGDLSVIRRAGGGDDPPAGDERSTLIDVDELPAGRR
jgi:uncharacterized membrane protein YcaP (DUF421 family)